MRSGPCCCLSDAKGPLVPLCDEPGSPHLPPGDRHDSEADPRLLPSERKIQWVRGAQPPDSQVILMQSSSWLDYRAIFRCGLLSTYCGLGTIPFLHIRYRFILMGDHHLWCKTVISQFHRQGNGSLGCEVPWSRSHRCLGRAPILADSLGLGS